MSRSGQLPNLDKLFKDDDEQEFAPQGGSNLAAIFGTPQRLELAPSTKKAPIRPKTSAPVPSGPPKTEVILAKVVYAYKLKSGQYSLIGQLGIALAGSPSARSYLLILYRTKQEHISVVPLVADFAYSVRENNYASYYDAANENWSILFENSDSSIEFAREIGIAKYFLHTPRPEDSVFSQDLTSPKIDKDSEAIKAEENDEVEINYSTIPKVTQPLKLGPLNQSMKVRITSDETWEKSLLGVPKNLRRLLILPPSKQISLGPGYPREHEIALEIEIVDIVKPEIEIPSPKPTPVGKASLISRMAKMGQSMLPKLPTSTTTDSEDTEEESQVKPRRSRGHLEPPQVKSPAVSPAQTLETRNSGGVVATFNHPWMPMQQLLSNDGHVYSYQKPIQPQMPIDPSINVFLSETRTHNAEIRMGMAKISDNVQKLLDKFHALELERCTSPMSERSLEGLKVLMGLRNDVRQSELSEDKASQGTRESLSECLRNLEKSEKERKEIDRERLELRERVQRLEGCLSEAQSALQKALGEVKDANDVAIKYQKENAELEMRVGSIEAGRKLLEKSLESLRREDESQVKLIMNRMYQALMGKFTEDSYTAKYIKNVLGRTIRSITLQVLQERKGEALGSDTEMKDSEGESKDKSRADEELMLPEVDAPSDRGIEMTTASHEEPPPIPPMDLDIENDWVSQLL